MDHSRPSVSEFERRVLLVEDDPDSLALMRRLLARLSVPVVWASTCADAVRTAEGLGRLDLIITDEALPDGRGTQLAGGLARRYGCDAIVVSGSPPEPVLPPGVRLWLTKPVDFARFREAVLARVA